MNCPAVVVVVLLASACGSAQQNQSVFIAMPGSGVAAPSLTEVGLDGTVLGTIPLGANAQNDLISIARDGSGVVVTSSLCYPGTGAQGCSLTLYSTSSGAVTPLYLPDLMGRVAIDAAGIIWTSVSDPPSFGGVFLSRFNQSGQVVGTAPRFTLGIADFALTPGGDVWVLAGGSGGVTLELRSPDAPMTLLGSLWVPYTPAGIYPLSFVCDPDGRAWIVESGGMPGAPWTAVRRFVWNGSSVTQDLSQTLAFAFSKRIVMDGCGTAYLESDQSPYAIVTKISREGVVLPPVTLPVSHVDSIAPDVDGNLWVQYTDANGFAAGKLSATGALLALPVFVLGNFALSRTLRGDVTGVGRASVVGWSEDADGDASTNRQEFHLGTAPFDPASRPPALSASTSPGQVMLTYQDSWPGSASAGYVLAAAGGVGVGIPIGPGGSCPIFPLDPDPIFALTFPNPPAGIFNGFAGSLANGAANATFNVPSGIPPNTYTLFFAGVTLGPGPLGVTALSAAIPVLIP